MGSPGVGSGQSWMPSSLPLFWNCAFVVETACNCMYACKARKKNMCWGLRMAHGTLESPRESCHKGERPQGHGGDKPQGSKEPGQRSVDWCSRLRTRHYNSPSVPARILRGLRITAGKRSLKREPSKNPFGCSNTLLLKIILWTSNSRRSLLEMINSVYTTPQTCWNCICILARSPGYTSTDGNLKSMSLAIN